MTEVALNDSRAELAGWMADELRPAPARRGIDLKHWAEEFADVYRVSDALSKTPFVPREMMGKTADVAAAIMKGRELGLDPFDALGSIYIIHGRVGYYAEFMRRRIIQAGHKLRVVESTDSRCVLEGIRKGDNEPSRATFTAEQAKRAKINLGDYPADKLLARATSRLCRQVFPDVMAGSVIAEDLIDGLIPTDEVKSAEPAAVTSEPGPAAIQRKRPTKPAKAASTQPPDAGKASRADNELDELLGDEPDEPPQPPADQSPASHAAEQRQDQDPSFPASPDLSEPAAEDIHEVIVDAVDLVTAPQLKKLSILLREAGFDTPESKHGFTSTAINREIASAKELTKDEASKVIDILENGSER